ncbi:M1 family metallopeptidase [Gemmatimonadota bacterium]
MRTVPRSIRTVVACTMTSGFLYLAPGFFGTAPVFAQQGPEIPESVPQTNQGIFAPLDLPTPTMRRDASGRPGPEYWQQTADYEIRVTLDPAAHRISGSEVITYTNNSPDELDFVWVHLDLNIFKTGGRSDLVGASSSRRRPTGGGVQLTRVGVFKDNEWQSAYYVVDDTRMRIDLPEPLAANGGTLQLAIDWSFDILLARGGRMGRVETEEGWVYELAQWYPRIVVYDDVSGWNPLPYLGQGEFYLEYGSFEVDITVPRDMLVVATGELQNPAEVLTTDQQRRLERARGSAETVAVIAPDEVGTAASRPAGTRSLTWRFHADHVRDFSWAASRAFVWDAAGWKNVLIMSVYPRESIGPSEEGDAGWEMATQYARHTISHYSEKWFPYPYPVAINVGGLAGGMEYPMIVFCSWRARGRSLFGVTDHEFGHTWFPMVVGSDERRHGWMDEGFNTFLNHYSKLAYYGSEPPREGRTGPETVTALMQTAISDQPIMTRADVLRPLGYGFLAYSKPAYGLMLLREVVLGPERFDAAFRTYIDRWAYRHPQPADFFRTMEDVSGEDLAWFWRGWFYSTDLLDQAVDSVTVAGGDENQIRATHIHLSNRQDLVMPTILEIDFADGTTARRTLPVEVWIRSDSYTLPVDTFPRVTNVTLDPDSVLPDVDRSNDSWPAIAPPASG